MKPSLVPGLKHKFIYKVPVEKTVPYTYREAAELQSMPEVFATGFMIILMEWTCTQLMAPHLDAGEGSLGTHVDVSHLAATLPGMSVTAEAELASVDGRRLEFSVRAHDGVDLIGEGRHQRAVVTWDKFKARVADKGRLAGVA
ncbi:MAG: thioesterase family protein [Xanthobacteraceae bacterium]|jgi:fluoroacetyl-CoA thioesterase|uniref:thioesterase family protein n=1 Tax=Pseudolabrys sp. TaxID=1960880 RepID=UPI003D098A69